jgi:hypothetical protein
MVIGLAKFSITFCMGRHTNFKLGLRQMTEVPQKGFDRPPKTILDFVD